MKAFEIIWALMKKLRKIIRTARISKRIKILSGRRMKVRKILSFPSSHSRITFSKESMKATQIQRAMQIASKFEILFMSINNKTNKL